VGSRVNARLEHLFLAFEIYCVNVNTVDDVVTPFRGAAIIAIPKGLPLSAISSNDNLRLRLELGLGSVVWLWQYQELFPATTMNDGFQNGAPFGMAALRNGGPESDRPIL